MSREEFLKILKESLSMSVDQSAINDQLDYYDKYISDEIKKGRSEKEVLDELGDPRLIAKTIKTVSISNEPKTENTEDDFDDDYRDKQRNNRNTYANIENSNVIGCTIGFLVVFIIAMMIFRALGSLAYGVGSLAFSGPLGFLLVCLLFWFLFGGRRR